MTTLYQLGTTLTWGRPSGLLLCRLIDENMQTTKERYIAEIRELDVCDDIIEKYIQLLEAFSKQTVMPRVQMNQYKVPVARWENEHERIDLEINEDGQSFSLVKSPFDADLKETWLAEFSLPLEGQKFPKEFLQLYFNGYILPTC